MINAEVLKALGPRGVLINVARGSVVDEPALIAALKSGTILAAGLDVFAERAEGARGTARDVQRGAAAAYRLGLGGDAQRDGSIGGRQSQGVVFRQAALDADFGDAGQGSLTMLGMHKVLQQSRGGAVAATLLVLAASPLAAQDAGALKKSMIGQWELSTTERSKTCVVTLKPDASPQGLKLELEPGCAAALPFTKDIASWNVTGLDIVRLQDGAGQPVIDFTEVESGIFEGHRSNEGIYILQNLAAARSLAKSMDQMIGDWSMVQGSGRTICGLTLTNTEATPDNFQVFLKPRCDPAVTAFRADDVAAGARRAVIDVGGRRGLAVRSRRQRAMAENARQRRSADHVAAVDRVALTLSAQQPSSSAKAEYPVLQSVSGPTNAWNTGSPGRAGR